MRVLVADDDAVSAEMLKNSLEQSGYEVTLARDGTEAFACLRSGNFHLVISDWEMPGISGLELCRQIRRRSWSSYIYFILLTSYSGVENAVAGLEAGADDFLTKPFHPDEIVVRLKTAERILNLESRDLTIFALAKLAESRDQETGAHLERIREYCRIIAHELTTTQKYHDDIDGDYVQLLYFTSPLHDIGKVGIPDRVLLKPGRLTPEEFRIMQQHTIIGGDTLGAAAKAHPAARFLTMARDVAMTHHERFDGKGYPFELSGRQIPLCGRITAVADVYDALRSKRVYKPEYSHETAKDIIKEGRGSHFDPFLVDVFLDCEEEFIRVHERFRELEESETLADPDCPASLLSSR
jgi:putative two-component system response regulator